ncbi:MAG: hypothetical protein H7068_12535 [Pedobacter sp.]|nr:hypothetical protein [Chitinophagaceae bacterium]
MVVWDYIVFVLSSLLLIFLIWKEVIRPLKLRLWWRIIASIIAIICLACLAIDIAYTTNKKLNINGKKLLLLTDGYDKDNLTNFITKNQQQVDTVSINQLSQTILKNFATLDILGYGLDEADLQLLNNQPINFLPSKILSGIVHINWKRQLHIGENLMVQGTYNNTKNKPATIYLNAFGDNIDSTTIKPLTQQIFQLQTIPKHNIRAVYSVIVTAKKDTLENNPLPFEVQATNPLKVLLLASSPNFENKFLKNWLYENNYAVATRTSVSKGKFEQSFSNIKKIGLDKLSPSILQQFDVLIADADELQAIEKNELSTIKNQVEQNGLGLIVQLDSIDNNATFYNKIFPVITATNQDKKETQLQFSNTNTSLQIEQPHYIKPQPNTQILVKNITQNSLASMALFGTGKMVATTLNNTYSLVLQNKENNYSQLWTLLLQKVAKKALEEDNWTVNPEMPHINQQTTLSLETITAPTFGLVGTTKIYLKQNQDLPFEWNGTYWPLKSGWHTVSSPNNNIKYWYVFNPNDWPNVAASQRVNATKLYALQHSIQIEKIIQPLQALKVVIPKIIFFLLFFLAASFLWLERKL